MEARLLTGRRLAEESFEDGQRAQEKLGMWSVVEVLAQAHGS